MMHRKKSQPARLKVIGWTLLAITFTWCLFALLLIPQPSMNRNAQQWLTQTQELIEANELNDSFFMLLGFDAPIDSSAQSYGEQRWRAKQNEDEQNVMVAPEHWRFGLPCYVSRVECWPTVVANMPSIQNVLTEQRAWVVRLQTLLTSQAPYAPLDRSLDTVSFPKDQLSSALELNLASMMAEITDGQEQLAFAKLDKHLGDLIRHIRTTNLRPYRSLLQRALKVELAWVVALLQQRPELAELAKTQLTILTNEPQLAASLKPILQRDFAIANQTFLDIDNKGISAALDWELEVSSLMKHISWQRQNTTNELAEAYQYALNLMDGQYGLEQVVHVAQGWPSFHDAWSERNLVGFALLQDKVEKLSELVRRSAQSEAYYALAASWITTGANAQPPESLEVLGAQVETELLPLQQRFCLKMPLIESMDNLCLRLYSAGKVADILGADQLSVELN